MHLEYMTSSWCFTDRATCRCVRSGSVLERTLVVVRPRGALLPSVHFGDLDRSKQMASLPLEPIHVGRSLSRSELWRQGCLCLCLSFGYRSGTWVLIGSEHNEDHIECYLQDHFYKTCSHFPAECVERCEVMGQGWSDQTVMWGVVEISRELEIGVIMPLFLQEERLLEYVSLGVMMVCFQRVFFKGTK